jgi:hypothetical protein
MMQQQMMPGADPNQMMQQQMMPGADPNQMMQQQMPVDANGMPIQDPNAQPLPTGVEGPPQGKDGTGA